MSASDRLDDFRPARGTGLPVFDPVSLTAAEGVLLPATGVISSDQCINPVNPRLVADCMRQVVALRLLCYER